MNALTKREACLRAEKDCFHVKPCDDAKGAGWTFTSLTESGHWEWSTPMPYAEAIAQRHNFLINRARRQLGKDGFPLEITRDMPDHWIQYV